MDAAGKRGLHRLLKRISAPGEKQDTRRRDSGRDTESLAGPVAIMRFLGETFYPVVVNLCAARAGENFTKICQFAGRRWRFSGHERREKRKND